MARTYHVYSRQIKERIVKLILDDGESAAVVAREWGINPTTVGTWVSRARVERRRTAGDPEVPSQPDLLQFQAKIIGELRDSNAKLVAAHEIIMETLKDIRHSIEAAEEIISE